MESTGTIAILYFMSIIKPFKLFLMIVILLIVLVSGKMYEYNTKTNERRWVKTAGGTAVKSPPPSYETPVPSTASSHK